MPRAPAARCRPSPSGAASSVGADGADSSGTRCARTGCAPRPSPRSSRCTTATCSTCPGSPRIIGMPGHSPGSIAIHVPAADAVFVGDALTTRHVLTGEHGPQPAPFTDDPDRRDRLAAAPRRPRRDVGAARPRHAMERRGRRGRARGHAGGSGIRFLSRVTSGTGRTPARAAACGSRARAPSRAPCACRPGR